MRYLLDTNVVSEIRRARPDPNVAAWFESVPADALVLSVLTVGEIQQGILRLARRDESRAKVLQDWLDGLVRGYGHRILPVTDRVVRRWAAMNVARTLPVIDSLIAATAAEHGATLVTRNVRDVAGVEVAVVDPWAG